MKVLINNMKSINRKWIDYVVEARVEQIVYEVTYLIQYRSETESSINFLKVKDEIRSIENVTIVKTTEETQILSGYEYRDLIIKVVLEPKVKIKDELNERILPKLKLVNEIDIVKLNSIVRISER